MQPGTLGRLVRQSAVAGLLSLGPVTPVAADPVDDFVNRQLRSQRIPGIAVAVVKDGAIVKAAGYGVADRDRGDAVTPDTVFRIGSISKSLVATGIARLVEDGSIRLDDPVGRYLDVPATWAPITIQHLLSHTSGLMRDPPGVDWATPQGSDADIIRTAFDAPVRFAPGSRGEYSNLNYIVLAEVMRVVTGRPWVEHLAARVFAPAAMTTTHLFTRTGVANRARGYSDNDRLANAVEWVAAPASGGFESTVMDLARWDLAMTANRIVSASTRARMLTPATLRDGTTYQVGLGFGLAPDGPFRRVRATGGMPGFLSELWHFPDHRLTVIVLINLDDADVNAIVKGVAALYLPPADR